MLFHLKAFVALWTVVSVFGFICLGNIQEGAIITKIPAKILSLSNSWQVQKDEFWNRDLLKNALYIQLLIDDLICTYLGQHSSIFM
jgi:hypothetical protein